jgi:hypothetical protein
MHSFDHHASSLFAGVLYTTNAQGKKLLASRNIAATCGHRAMLQRICKRTMLHDAW